jgi:hypothetical protein
MLNKSDLKFSREIILGVIALVLRYLLLELVRYLVSEVMKTTRETAENAAREKKK